MNLKLTFPLLILGVLSFISIVFGDSLVDISMDFDLSTDLLINGSVTTIEMEGYSFNMSLLSGSFIVLTAISLIAVGMGVVVVSSGISETAQKTALKVIVYIAIWTMLSYTSLSYLYDIAVFGIILYGVLFMLYLIGVLQVITERG